MAHSRLHRFPHMIKSIWSCRPVSLVMSPVKVSCSLLPSVPSRLHKLKMQGSLFGQDNAWSCTWPHPHIMHIIHLYIHSQRWTAHSNTGTASASTWTYTIAIAFFTDSSCFSSTPSATNTTSSTVLEISLLTSSLLSLKSHSSAEKNATYFFVMMCSQFYKFTLSVASAT